MLTVAAASRRLNVAPATIYRACRRGHLEHVRIGRAIRIPESALTPKQTRCLRLRFYLLAITAAIVCGDKPDTVR